MAKNNYKKWKNKITIQGYNTWKGLFGRCYNESHEAYRNYGGRGIVVCDRWFDYDNFILDMGSRPDGTSLDRIDNDGDYCPSNCRWATQKEQCNNTRRSAFIEHEGTRMTISEWCDFLKLSEKDRTCAYKRYSKYEATSFDDIFYKGRLFSKRRYAMKNKCLCCGLEESCKWRMWGKQCNNCYHVALRWSKRELKPITEHPSYKRFFNKKRFSSFHSVRKSGS